jgi:lysozyme family protein
VADFEKAHRETMGKEGGYSANPSDVGGETYKGIARNFHPDSIVWKYIDNIKVSLPLMPAYGSSSYYPWTKNLNRYATANPALQMAVLGFYLENYWNLNRLDEVASQAVANQIYDWAVNTGSRGNRWIQQALGITADGVIGPITVAAINGADPVSLLLAAREYAKAHRLEVCARRPDQKQFLAGWLLRDGFSHDEIAGIMA